jgi:hypothetical protein
MKFPANLVRLFSKRDRQKPRLRTQDEVTPLSAATEFKPETKADPEEERRQAEGLRLRLENAELELKLSRLEAIILKRQTAQRHYVLHATKFSTCQPAAFAASPVKRQLWILK